MWRGGKNENVPCGALQKDAGKGLAVTKSENDPQNRDKQCKRQAGQRQDYSGDRSTATKEQGEADIESWINAVARAIETELISEI
jgi:hypothetical protein